MDGGSMIMDRQLENISDLTKLKLLTLKNRKIGNASLLSGLTDLDVLILVGSTFSDVSPLAKLTKLTKLDISANSFVKDISSLHTLKKMKKFIAGGGGETKGLKNVKGNIGTSMMEIGDIDVMINFSDIVEFNFSYNNRLRSIDPLKHCLNMEEVYLNNCLNLEDVSALGAFKKMSILNISSCPKVKELCFLSDLPTLADFSFNGTIVYSPGFLSNWKTANNMFALKGNDADPVSRNFVASAKKRVKQQKILKKAFTK
jgi:hypothetical protein